MPRNARKMPFDAHAHLPASESCELPEGWSGVVCAVRESEFERLAALAGANAGVIPAFGLHPWFLRERSAGWLETLRFFIESTPRAEIGEIGLDKIRIAEAPLEEQAEVFRTQLRLAATQNLPAHLHCVRAWGEMMSLLRAEKHLPKLHFHAFSGSVEIARELLKTADATFSFSPQQLRSESGKLRRVRASLPPERLFEESDAPLDDF